MDLAQVKALVELCINKLSDAAAKSELKANCEKFDSELGELGTPDGLTDSCVSSGIFGSPLAVRPKEASDGFHTIGDVMPLTASAHVVACATTAWRFGRVPKY